MSLAVVLVHYRTPELARDAVDALRADLAEEAGSVEWLLVDNGCDAGGQAILRQLPLRIVQPGENLGFAGAVNLGVDATSAEHVVVLNPDVQVLPGCIAALRERLRAGSWVAGPRFFWDHDKRLLLPPPERRTRRDEALAVAAAWGEGWARRGRRRWRRHARRHWCALEPFSSTALSGALLAFRRQTFERAGPFDAGFRLYFEESDWLQRVRRAGLRTEHVPAAAAVHLYARSTVQEPTAAAWFAASRHRFFRRYYGRWFTALVEALARRAPIQPADESVPETDDEPRLEVPRAGGGESLWVEVSPSRSGFPAAGERLGEQSTIWSLPEEVRHRLEPGVYSLQVVDASGRELVRGRWAPQARQSLQG